MDELASFNKSLNENEEWSEKVRLTDKGEEGRARNRKPCGIPQ